MSILSFCKESVTYGPVDLRVVERMKVVVEERIVDESSCAVWKRDSRFLVRDGEWDDGLIIRYGLRPVPEWYSQFRRGVLVVVPRRYWESVGDRLRHALQLLLSHIKREPKTSSGRSRAYFEQEKIRSVPCSEHDLKVRAVSHTRVPLDDGSVLQLHIFQASLHAVP